MGWAKDVTSWRLGHTLYLSVPFTWLLPQARRLALAHRRKGPVVAGGPAVRLLPDQLADVAQLGQESPVPPLALVNPLATFTTRGCPNRCGFCAVPRIEGEFSELKGWEVRPIICDNNLLAASRAHFDLVMDRLKVLPWVDFNQGLDPRLFRPHHARRIAELRAAKVRFSFDHVRTETAVADAVTLCHEHGLRDIGIYVLVGYRDTPQDALYRLEVVRSWGIRPNPMRYQPLDSLTKNSHVAPGWDEAELLRLVHYWSRLRWLEHVPYADYEHRSRPRAHGVQGSLFIASPGEVA